MTRAGEEDVLDDLIAEHLDRPLSRRTLLARGRDLGLTVAASSFLSACASTVATHRIAAPKPEAVEVPPKYLVMVIIDAGRPDYLEYGNLPHIKRLMQRGTFYDRAWVGQLEAVTPASHATIGSGCHPSHDGGILGFWWEDPVTHTPFNSVQLNGTDRDSLSVLLGDAGTPTMAEYLKRHDHRAKLYAASAQKFYAADGAGGPFADYISYYNTTPEGGWAPYSIPGHELPQAIMSDPIYSKKVAPPAGWGHQDYLAGQLAAEVIRKERPRIVILNLPEMDWPVAHLDGGPVTPSAVRAVMENVDKVVGNLVAECEAAGILSQTVFMLLGDHGVTPLEKFVGKYDIKNVLETVDTVVSHDTHTGSFSWLANPRLAEAAARAVEDANLLNISAVYYLTEVKGRRTYLPAPNTAAATRGRHKTLGDGYRYLLQTVAGANAPHVVCFYPERTGTLNSGGPNPWKGDHGGGSWGVQGIPLIIAGPGVKANHVSHFPARLADLAPTGMRLIGVPYPRTDGLVLADSMTNPSALEVRRQHQAAQYLVPYAEAIRRQSAREVVGLPAMAPVKTSKQSQGSIATGPHY